MSKPETCVCCGRVIPEGSQYCVICGNKVKGKQTNYDRIRGMSVEEMSFLLECSPCGYCELYEGQNCDNTSCNQGIRQWLESEVDN